MSDASSSQPAISVLLYFAYSHADRGLRAKLDAHLALLKREGVISTWFDHMISGGAEWRNVIHDEINAADIILLLISADFLASDYCYDVEMKRALERHSNGDATVVPIILRPVDWHSGPFAHLQALPRDGKPVTTWANREQAFLDIVVGIRRIAVALSAPVTEHQTSTARIRVREKREVVIIDIVGRLMIVSASSLPPIIFELVREGKRRFLLNLEDCSYIDSSGIGALMTCASEILLHGGTLKLLHVSKRINGTLQISKMYSVLEVFDDEGAAIRSFRVL